MKILEKIIKVLFEKLKLKHILEISKKFKYNKKVKNKENKLKYPEDLYNKGFLNLLELPKITKKEVENKIQKDKKISGDIKIKSSLKKEIL